MKLKRLKTGIYTLEQDGRVFVFSEEEVKKFALDSIIFKKTFKAWLVGIVTGLLIANILLWL